MTIRFRPVLQAGCCLLALTAASGAAQAASDDYDWLGIMYLWAADIGVDTRDASINVDFSDTIDKLEMAFQGHVEVQGDDIGGFVDLSFIAVGDNSQRANAHLNSDLDLTAVDMALVWSPGAERVTGLEVFGGLRYIDTDFSLVVDPDAPALPDIRTGINTTYTDLLAGVRYGAPFGNNWKLIVTADASAFDTEGTWSLGTFAVYRTGPHRFYAGYRHFELDLKGSSGQKVTETLSGPAIAYGYAF
jgi:hypothetical protein